MKLMASYNGYVSVNDWCIQLTMLIFSIFGSIQ